MKIAIVLGTRPEIIKLSPIIRECQKQNIDFFILHTNQHYAHFLDKLFFDELNLPQPKYNLNVGSDSHARQSAKMLKGIEKILLQEAPDVILVQGDTNTVLAGALAAVKLQIKIGHVEAGLRSYDKTMPEEINRILADHCCDFAFAPTPLAGKILLKEGLCKKNIFITGNTIVDAVLQNIAIARKNSKIIQKLGIKPGNFALLTCHRQENTDDSQRLKNILSGINRFAIKENIKIIFPVHPRTAKTMAEKNISCPNQIKIIEPVGFSDFLILEKNARIIFTDSGGVQEEACILGTPCITLRENTERPETVTVKANVLAGTSTHGIEAATQKMLKTKTHWKNPFGDGKASQRIITQIQNEFEKNHKKSSR